MRKSCLLFNLFIKYDSDLFIILGQRMALMRSDRCPCWADYTKVNSEHQLRVPSRGGWPRGIMTTPSPGKSNTQERDICSRTVGPFLLKSHPFTLGGFGLYFSCVVREAPQMPWERGWSWGWTNQFLSSVTHSLTVLEEPFRRSFWWIMVHPLGLSFVAWPSILVWARVSTSPHNFCPLLFGRLYFTLEFVQLLVPLFIHLVGYLVTLEIRCVKDQITNPTKSWR